MNSLPISAIVITKNEEANIARCLGSLNWVDEIILLDSGSTDSTMKIAAQFNNVKCLTTEWLGYSATKQAATDKSKNEWILWVDADEVISDQLREEIIGLKSDNNHVAFEMPRKTFFMGQWVKHCGWYPGRVTRLFNKNSCRFNNKILHEGLDINGSTGRLKADILHYSYTSLYQYFDKMNYYGKFGAEELVRKGRKFGWHQLIINPLHTFIKTYFFNKGILDGTTGFIISVGSSFSNFIKYVNFYYLSKELNENNNKQNR
ncbi:MAG: glycosyltransferase family 2 protein [Cytophagaceae bacterium]